MDEKIKVLKVNGSSVELPSDILRMIGAKEGGRLVIYANPTCAKLISISGSRFARITVVARRFSKIFNNIAPFLYENNIRIAYTDGIFSRNSSFEWGALLDLSNCKKRIEEIKKEFKELSKKLKPDKLKVQFYMD